MKKFITGLCVGIAICLSTVVSASDSIQALIFPAKFDINGKDVSLSSEYTLLNVEGHAYVPVRFVAEQLGATIDYDNERKLISIKNEHLSLRDPAFNTISVGNLITVRAGALTRVIGQLQLDSADLTENMVDAYVSFYDENESNIGEASITGVQYGSKPTTFETAGSGDFTRYSSVKLHVRSVNYRIVDGNTKQSVILNMEQAIAIAKTYNSTEGNPSWSARFQPYWSDPDQRQHASVWVITALYPQSGSKQIVTIDAYTGAILADADVEGGEW